MTPTEALTFYNAAWPKLKAELDHAIARGDALGARGARRKLSFLSDMCAARHRARLAEPKPVCPELDDLRARVEELERAVALRDTAQKPE